MNVIVSNVNASKFNNLDIDVIKSISGEFTADEIVQSFSNFFFNRMFLDITAIQNYLDVNTLKKISVGLDVSKIILLLTDDVVINSDSYISNLVSMGFYNFAHTEDELRYLYDNPNTYRDVAHLQKISEPVSEPIIPTKVVNSNAVVIGFKNVSSHAGATSLIYMLKKHLSQNYFTVAIEVNKKDFMFYNDKKMVSCNENDLSNCILQYRNANVILVDLNNCDVSHAHSLCKDVIYLMESSVIMINRMIMLDNKCFEKLSLQKVVLNRSLLNDYDVKKLQQESGITFYYTLPPLDDRADNSSVFYPFLEKLGLYRKV